jgi:hypothetical protein
LINNFSGYSIEWVDIASMQLTEGMRGFGKLSINLKDPLKYYNTRYKKTMYHVRQLFIANDNSIAIDFIAGNNEEIFATIKAYWTAESGD